MLVVSDHGFQAIQGEIHLNSLLEKWGYLKRKPVSQDVINRIKRAGFIKLDRVFRRLPPAWQLQLTSRVPKNWREKAHRLYNQQPHLARLIDWERTRAFSYGYMGKIFLHQQGKYAQGIVTPGRGYKRLRQEIIERLRKLKAPDTGQPVVGKIFSCEEIYQGPKLKTAPDIIFLSSKQGFMFYGNFGEDWFSKPKQRVADHNLEGIYILRSSQAKAGRGPQIRMIDIAPTLLYLHNLAVPESMDGQIVKI